jgi:hypothetical protein
LKNFVKIARSFKCARIVETSGNRAAAGCLQEEIFASIAMRHANRVQHYHFSQRAALFAPAYEPPRGLAMAALCVSALAALAISWRIDNLFA